MSSDAHAIRPIRPSDKSALQRFHARLSPEALYRRYHGIKGDLTPAELRFLTETDELGHIARVAVDEHGEIDAVARVVDGEIAVVVADGRRRALRLFARLGARRRGCEPGGTIELVIPADARSANKPA